MCTPITNISYTYRKPCLDTRYSIPDPTDEYKITFSTSLGFGVYTVMAYCGGVKIPGSPFEVTVESMSNVVASGDGLTAATTNQKSTFEVDFTEDVGKKLEVVIER